MKRLPILLLLPLVAWAGRPNGEPETFEWTTPTKYEDGSTLSDSEISGYAFFCSLAGAAAIRYDVPNLGGTVLWQVPLNTFEPGIWACAAITVATNGLSSVQTGPVGFTVRLPPSRPLPPTGLQVR